MNVSTLFSGTSSVGKIDLYAFVLQLSKCSASMIKTKAHSFGMVEDLCEILHAMYGIKVASLIGRENRSWIIVYREGTGTNVFLDTKELPIGSSEREGLIGFFTGNRTFLNNFPEPAPQCTHLVIGFDCEHSSLGVQTQVDDVLCSTPAEKYCFLPPKGPFPWAVAINTANSNSILHNVINALCAHAFALPVDDLICNAHRFFLMRSSEEKFIAMVNFVTYEQCWLPLEEIQIPNKEEQFSMMLNNAGQYGTATEEVKKRLLMYFARFCTSCHVPVEPDECYQWQTPINFKKGDSLIAAILREKEAQESNCYHLRTDTDTILPIICEKDMAIYRGLLVTDTHPSFGSIIALRSYVTNNIKDMLERTAAATGDIGELVNLLRLWELVSKFVVQDVCTYMTRCDWMARDIFLSVISMYKGQSEKMALSTFLHDIQFLKHLVRVSGDIALLGDSVFFLTMPTTAECLAAKAFHAVMTVDPVQAGCAISNNAFQTFLEGTDASELEEYAACGKDSKALTQDMEGEIGFSFPDDVTDADKATLFSLLKFKRLHHLLALFSPAVPSDMAWVGAVVTEERENIFSLASEASLIGMTTDLVVFVLNKKLYLTVMNGVTDSAVGSTLITEVVNTYNMLTSNVMPGLASMKYSIHEVVMLFRIFNVGYRKAKSGQQMLDPSRLRKAMVHTLFGFDHSVTCHLEAVWLETMDFLLSGAISHRVCSNDDGDSSIHLQGSDTCLNTMLAATYALYLDRVHATEVVPGSIYFLQRGVSSTFMVETAVLEKHEHLLRNVELKGVCTDPATVGILASILVKSLGLTQSGEFCKIKNVAKIHNTIVSRHKGPNPIPFIVRQTLRVLWSKYQGQVYFPNVEPDNENLISIWERNIADESMPFYRTVINLVLLDGHLNGRTRVFLDDTLSVILQNGIGDEEETSASMLVTDWPLSESWETYTQGIERLCSALNTYKENALSHPVSSLMQLDQILARIWVHVKHKQTAIQTLLPQGTYFFLDSVRSLVKQITDKTDDTTDAVVKVLDKAVADKNVSLVTEEDICAIKLLEGKEQKSIIVISGYPFALLDKSIVLPFNSISQRVELKGAIGHELLWISHTLMGMDGMTQDANVIKNKVLADWLLACMPMIPAEKQKRASFLCLSGLLGQVHSFWEQNREVVENSVVHAVDEVTSGKVTKESQRRFLREVFTPLMDSINREPNVCACLLLDPASSCHYYVMCTETTIEVGMLDRGNDNKAMELTEWLEATKALISISSLQAFMKGSKINGVPPVGGDATTQLFASMPHWPYRQDSHTAMMDSVIRGSVLNAWTRDVPALEMYTKSSLIAIGRKLATVPCIDDTSSSGDCFSKLDI